MGTASSWLGIPASLVQLCPPVYQHIRKWWENPELIDRVAQLFEQLQFVKHVPDPDFKFEKEELESVSQILDTVRGRSAIGRFLAASRDNSALVEAQGKLESLRTQFSVLHVLPTIFKGKSEAPRSKVGLNRGKVVLDFLEQSQLQHLRVIAIVGQAGIGKTTLLNSVLQGVADKVPFYGIVAYIQMGHGATDQTIRQSQTDILRQLGGSHLQFMDCAHGREALKAHLKALGKAVYLAIDNVYNYDDLVKLLPEGLGSANLPTSSCIALTCKDRGIAEALFNICGLQEKDKSRVYLFEPGFLNEEESRELFVANAEMPHSGTEHKELLDKLVPLCGGLPLALSTLGRIFVQESRRERKAWQSVEKKWRRLDGVEADPVRTALRLSFDILESSCQLGFLDIVSTFYGWPWERVQRIVGSHVMDDLFNKCLVWKVESIYKCNRKALREGHSISGEHSISGGSSNLLTSFYLPAIVYEMDNCNCLFQSCSAHLAIAKSLAVNKQCQAAC